LDEEREARDEMAQQREEDIRNIEQKIRDEMMKEAESR